MSCPHLFPLGRAMLRTSGNLPSSLTSIWLVKTKRNNRRAQKEEINSISYKVMGKREQKDQHLSKSHQNNWPAAQIKPARKRRSSRRCLTVPLSTVSGRLSPPSLNCTPESKTEPVAPAEQKSSSAAIKSAPVDAPKTTKVDFDDDWENDDLLKDSFVLEMTPNPVSLNVAQKPSTAQPESCSSRM